MRPITAAVLAVLLVPLPAWAQTTQPSPEDRIAALREKLPGWKASLDHLTAQGQDVSYPMVTYTVIENFLDYAEEDLRVHVPDNWGYRPVNGSDSGMEVVEGDAHSGRTAVRVVNRSPFQPNRYGMLECAQTLTLRAGTPYTFSVWAKTTSPGTTSLAAGAGWQFRVAVPDTKGQWRRVELKFTPGPGDVAFAPRVLSERESAGVLLDDFYVCEGSTAEAGKNLVANGDLESGWTQRRAAYEVSDMAALAPRLQAMIEKAQTGHQLPVVPRWTGAERPKVQGPSFVGPTTRPGAAAPERRPIFFVGYGHFGQARKDIPKFPRYGVNIIQQEAGPQSLYPAEGKTDLAPVERIRETLRDAAKHGVAVDLLLSPHYFPGWMFAKYPDLRKQRADFFPFSVYHAAVAPLLKRYVADLLSGIKDEPALLSICLSNEPINVEEPSQFAANSWHEWLRRKHGDVATLNGRWGTKYADFAAVPYPNPFGPAAGEARPSPMWADWVRFNDEYFAAFHRMLADAVHAVAPDLPVHAKATTWNYWRSEDARCGDDATLFAGFSDIMGNDSVNLWGFDKEAPADGPVERGTREFAQGWLENALSYDLLRSAKDAPVFNSENHLIFDREPRWVSPDHVRAALWQQALHGQSATTIWVWERSTDRQSDAAGSIMERPLCVEAVGRVCLDLNRVATEMTALQTKPADVHILQSVTSATWDGPAGQDALVQTYTALSFTGLKIGFITERQLEAGTLPTAAAVVVPDVRHLSAAAAKALAGYKGKIIFVGAEGQCLSRDEYDKPATPPAGISRVPFTPGKTKWGTLLDGLAPILDSDGVRPSVRVDGTSGEPSRDVQWLPASVGGKTVVNVYNPRPDPVAVRLSADGATRATNLLSGQSQDLIAPVRLQPLEVRLYRLD